MPSYGGDPIFGTAVSMRTSQGTRARQVNAFSGISGMESLDMGGRGRVTSVTGRFVCDSASALNEAEDNFRSYADNVTRVLIDMYGNAWPDVILDAFEPTGKVQQWASGDWSRTYEARFIHLL